LDCQNPKRRLTEFHPEKQGGRQVTACLFAPAASANAEELAYSVDRGELLRANNFREKQPKRC
jgi:hypothetical protein